MHFIRNLWHGIIYCSSLLIKKEFSENSFSSTATRFGLALNPLRGYICSALVLIPFFFLIIKVRNLDPNYTQLLFPLLFCLIIEKMTHLRRINAFCRCVEAINSPGRAAQIMQTRGSVALSANGLFITFFLLAAKLMILYMLVTKFLVIGMKSDSELLIDFALIVSAITVFAEVGTVLLLTGDGALDKGVVVKGDNPKDFKVLLPLLFACLSAFPLVVMIWLRISQNAVLLPAALVMFMVFFWKHKADKNIGKVDTHVGMACYESCELAAMIGILIV